MIHVNRNKVSPPDSLADPGGTGARETKEAIDFFNDQANRGKKFPFKAYSGDKVKEKLNQLFHYKCAYCESYFGAVHPVDVEHFRPKAAVLVDGRSKGKGYYWLAARWDNLLPSCIDCNRPRKHVVNGQKSQTMGKAREFPLADESKRAMAPGEESREERLLLNPCLDDPDKHLSFEIEVDDEVVVRPRLSNGRESRKGKESIRVYALQRPGLALARQERFELIKAQVSRVNRYIKRLDRDPEDEEIQGWLNEEMQELKRLQADDQPYAAMARQYVKSMLG